MPDNTPMMRQYNEIKAKNPDCLLFFRLGDFYEMFGEDALAASRELDLVLTTRDRATENPEERVPMCGVPHHSSEAYIARLVSRGYKVAICEQLEDPKAAKGIVDRDVIRIVTPGTVTEPSMLDEGAPNYLAAVYASESGAAVCYADISTGEMAVVASPGGDASRLLAELAVISPREAILGGLAAQDAAVSELLEQRLACFTQTQESRFSGETANAAFIEALGKNAFEETGLLPGSPEVIAAGALLGYVSDTRRAPTRHLRFAPSGAGCMELDYSAIRGLELTASNSTGEKKGSLLWALDYTKTAMGRRTLRRWVRRPLLSPAAIRRRQDAVAELVGETVTRAELFRSLRGVGDLERLAGKIAYGTANARDLLSLADASSSLDATAELLAGMKSPALIAIAALDRLTDARADILDAIDPDPPLSVKDGGIIRPGRDAELDRLRGLVRDGGGALTELERRERERTGIKLKIGYNRVFGYYIEMPRSKSESVPEGYERRQTLANTERFVTPELKKLESELLSAQELAASLEYDIYKSLLEALAARGERILKTASDAAELDALCSLAEAASRNSYTCPDINPDGVIDIKSGRHPVVELTRGDTLFVPNDTYLDTRENIAAVVTGPNMAGKSTYMRQTALIVLMAQMGSFVPAASASIGIVDKIFTRIGASDDLASGKSTFMVEMTETAEILKNATNRSLLIFDEIGRGTSTYDGVAIARAILEHCAVRLRAKTLFSTHYHELSEAEGECRGIKCYVISARRRGGELIFLRKISPGGARDSYGIDVARLAGLPRGVIDRAREVMTGLTSGTPTETESAAAPGIADEPDTQISLFDAATDEIAEKLRAADLDTLSPIEALNMLFELKKLTGGWRGEAYKK
ncbi:MAG: DNA mismatch repair protein MutS [Oscillospiraceae bacterium]|jgi:DNA mismatch repair protein MutS|nr:DNA mismatch repair protein MutS [Oscillospiraceae bacterium]